jgi:hypothetical protein
MRFIQHLSHETIPLLQKVYQKSQHHRVRQRAQCILLSYQGYTTNELAHMFKVDRITIYNWFNQWESRHFAGLYDRKGKGRNPIPSVRPFLNLFKSTNYRGESSNSPKPCLIKSIG